MSLVRKLALVTLVALFVASAPVHAQLQNPNEPTPTNLYFHIFDTFNKFVINTQPMNTTFFEVGGTNFPTITGTPVNTVMGADYDFNTIYGTSTAGPVEYDFIENGKPRFHPEPGIAADVIIDTDVEPIVYIYFDIRDVRGVNTLPGFMPDFTVEVTMRTGDDPGLDANLDAGELIMSGRQTAHLYDGHAAGATNAIFSGQSSPDGTPVYTPDENGMVEFAIPMTLAAPVSSCPANAHCIPEVEAFNIRIDWYQLASTPLVQDDQFSKGYIRLVSHPDYLPRLELSIMNPVYISFIHPQVAAGTLLIHSGVNSPWGTYDVDAQNITVRIDGPSQPQRLDQVIAQNQHVHGLHHLDAEVTYLWRFREEGAANGQYTITMEVPNMAGTSVAVGRAGFVIEGRQAFGIDEGGEIVAPGTHDDQDSPAAAALLAMLALLGAAMAARRRRW